MNREELKDAYNIQIWDEETTQAFQETLLDWYDQQKRDLPWRRTSDPYKIWVSEIMLQQTQVATVIPYYEKFIKTYPDIQSLAESNEDDLLKIWEGLGYYSRARNMREAAQQIMEDYGGVFPEDPKEIKKLKGIGPYTSGAISSIAFNVPEPAVDGNLMRVLARLFEVDLDVKKPSNRKVFEAITRLIIDQDRPGDFNQALMDLGATISTPKNYNPELSPVKDFDQSYLNETWEKYPVTSKGKKTKEELFIAFAIKNQAGDYLLEKRPSKGLLANMWIFPMLNAQEMSDHTINIKDTEVFDQNDLAYMAKLIERKYGIDTQLEGQFKANVSHVFSHLKWSIYLLEGQIKEGSNQIPDHCEWVKANQVDDYAFPVVQQKMWQSYFELSLF